jgi:hypothetical protein
MFRQFRCRKSNLCKVFSRIALGIGKIMPMLGGVHAQVLPESVLLTN